MRVHVAGAIVVALALMGALFAPVHVYRTLLTSPAACATPATCDRYAMAYAKIIRASGGLPAQAGSGAQGFAAQGNAVMRGASWVGRLEWRFNVNMRLFMSLLLPQRLRLTFPGLALVIAVTVGAAIFERTRMARIIRFRVIPQETHDIEQQRTPQTVWAAGLLWLGVAIYIAPLALSVSLGAALIAIGAAGWIAHLESPLLNP
jgi:hypothetical protein